MKLILYLQRLLSLMLGLFLSFYIYAQDTCPINYMLDIEEDVYTVSLLSDTTLVPPFNITSTAQIVLKVSTGGFQVDSLTNLLDEVIFSNNSRTNAPEEAPNFDYISFGLASRGTQSIPYESCNKVPLFSFKNGGILTEDAISLMDNFTDPFINNSRKEGIRTGTASVMK